MSLPDENLDDVIASLIDMVDEERDKDSAGSSLKDLDHVSLTERAAKQIKKIKLSEKLDESLYLRVAVEGGGCSGLSYKLGFDLRSDEDELVQSQGMDIVVDRRHMIYLNGIVIDYPDGLDARGFTFDNPNASESCGCGTSFAV
jgi:iron-sulfur cluster assembly protein